MKSFYEPGLHLVLGGTDSYIQRCINLHGVEGVQEALGHGDSSDLLKV